MSTKKVARPKRASKKHGDTDILIEVANDADEAQRALAAVRKDLAGYIVDPRPREAATRGEIQEYADRLSRIFEKLEGAKCSLGRIERMAGDVVAERVPA